MFSLICKMVFDSSCSRVPIVSCIFFFFFFFLKQHYWNTHAEVSEEYQVFDMCPTWIRHPK